MKEHLKAHASWFNIAVRSKKGPC